MPAQRKQSTFTLNLGDLVSQQTTIFKTIKARSQDIAESKFQQRVTAEGLSYAGQLDYYQKILAREQDKRQPDQDYINNVNTNIANLKKLVRVDKYNQEYRASLEALNSGKASIDDHINFLQSQLGSAVDLDLRDKIKDAVTQANTDKYTIQKNILNNQIQYALKDKSVEILQSMLNTVNGRRTTALQNGDEEWASALNISVLTLKQQIASSKLEHAVNDFIAGSAVSDDNPITYLNRINGQISLADTNDPVTVNGTTYNNASAYWQAQKDTYLSSGKFYNELADYYKRQIDAANIRSQDTLLPNLQSVKKNLEQLLGQPDLQNYKESLKNTVDLIVGYGADIAGTNVVNQAKNDYNFSSAAKKLSSINSTLGIDMTTRYDELVNQVSTLNYTQAQNIINNAEAYQAKNPNASTADALNYAIQYTPNLIVSPTALAGKSPEEIAKGAFTTEGMGTKVTLPKPEETPIGGATGQRTVEGNYPVGSYVKLPTSPTVYKVISGTELQPLVGPWTEQDFQELTGKNFAQGIKTVSNFANYSRYSDYYEFMKESAGIKAPSILKQEETERKRIEEEKKRQDELKRQEQQQTGGATTGGGTTGGGTQTAASQYREGVLYKNPANPEIFVYKGGQLHWIKGEDIWKKLYGNKPMEGSYETLPETGRVFGETIDEKNYSKYI